MTVVPPLVYCQHGYCETEHCRTCEIMGVCKLCAALAARSPSRTEREQ